MLATTRVARADASAAEALFREGRSLLVAGHVAEACQKFEESQRMDPSSGTLMNLAHCHAELGRSASAWTEFLAAARLAAAQGKHEREAEALRRAHLLEPVLARVAIHVRSTLPNLEVERDGELLTNAEIGVPLPVDPGRHKLVARAPGFREWSAEFDVEAGREHVIEVPELTELPAPPPPRPSLVNPHRAVTPPPARPSAAAPEPQREVGAAFWVAAGTTALAAGTATVAGVLSLADYDTAEDRCPTHRDCDDEALAAWERAQTEATVCNVALAFTAVGAGVTTYLFFDDWSSPSASGVKRRRAEIALRSDLLGARVTLRF